MSIKIDLSAQQIEEALICWVIHFEPYSYAQINTFPNLPKEARSFDDLCDGIIFLYLIKQM